MKSTFYFLIIILFSTAGYAQLIVNVENSRIQSNTTGWKGSIGTSFGLTKNVEQIINLNANVHLQYKTKKDMYLFLANYNFLRGNNKELTNNMFYHLRYNRKFLGLIRWEAFTQWQQNNITNIDLRALAGMGPRFKLHESKRVRLFAGVLAMYEHEVDKNPREVHNDVRSDNYISFTYKPNDIFDLTTTTFYQPLFRRFSDFRVLNQVSFNIKATRRLTLSVNWDYTYDAFPAIGTPKINYTLTNGFNYNF